MGGLYGFLNKTKSFDSRVLIKKMRDSLTHQSWHSDEMVIGEDYAFGRKGVVPSEFQPIYNESRDCLLMLDGDIFSIKNIGKKYSETYNDQIMKDILESFINLPSTVQQKMDGDFNMLFADLNTERFTLANDIFGLRHLFYYNDENIFIFAPEIDAILQHSEINRELNYASISDYFYYNTVVHNNTYFKHIHLLPPASVLKIDKEELKIHNYWFPDYKEDRIDVSYDDLLEEGYELWKNAIHKRIKGKEKIAIPLSGGLDSRLLVAFTQMKDSNIFAFTHDEKGGDEHRIAKIVAKHFKLSQYELFQFNGYSILNNLEEAVRLKGGMVQHSAILLDMAKNMSNQYDVFLNGSFAMGLSFTTHYFKEDEINKNFSIEEKITRISQRCGERYFGQFAQRMLKKDFISQIKKYKGVNIKKGLEDFNVYSDSFHKQKDLFLIQTLKRRRGVGIDLWKYFVNDVLPLADYDLFKFYLRLPSKYKLNREFHYEIIRRKFPDLAKIEYQRTGVDLFTKPAKLTQMKRKYFPLLQYYIGRLSYGKLNIVNKTLFDNSNIWYRRNSKLQKYFQEILLDERTGKRGYYNLKELSELLSLQKRGGNYFNLIDQLVEFELTNRLFFD